MKNTLGDLNNHLFAELERLSDKSLTGENLVEEIERAKAITSVSNQVISNGKLVLDVMRIKDVYLGGDTKKIPAMLRDSYARK